MRTDTPAPVSLSEYSPFPFHIDKIDLTFSLDPTATLVDAVMAVRRTGPAGTDLLLDGNGLTLKMIEIDGEPIDADRYTQTEAGLTITSPPDAFILHTRVEISPEKNSALSGLYISGGRFCTQCEAEGFRRITYWPDRPDVMSVFSARIEADATAYPILLSNGEPGSSGTLENGRHFAEWDDPHPKPSYLFALCAGDYDVYRDTFTTKDGRNVALGIYVDKGDSERAAWAMDSLKRSMTWDEEVFGRAYDLDTFNIVAVRDFNFGAMENKGLNIFNSAYVLADDATATDADFEAIESIVAHEYFHNWTGNRITCRDWFQLCLKEGLTVFRDQEFSADMRSRPVQRIKDVVRLRARQFAEDAGPLAHPVRPSRYASIDNLYTATVYEKGAELIRMLKATIGAEAFAKGMDIYFQRHDGDAATIEDFYACFEAATGRDLADFRRWYAQPGTPRVRAEEEWDEATGTLTLHLSQTNPVTPGNDAPKSLPIPLRTALISDDGTVLKEERLDLSEAETKWSVVGLDARPFVSINRGFSAPIRLDHAIDTDQRLAGLAVEDDRFNQWDGFQTLVKADLTKVAYGEADGVSESLLDALAAAARATSDDPAFAALLLRLPDVGELMQDRTPADPAALQLARNAAKSALSARLTDWIDETLGQPAPTPYSPESDQASLRARRGAAVDLLASSGGADAPARLKDLYDAAPDMTEKLTALRALVRLNNTAERQSALNAFYADWSSNPLVLDKWFAAQASVGTAETAQSLVDHPDFDLGNPNRVRAVAAVFAMQNLAAFHASDGSGYRFLAGLAAAADVRNPALAARLLTAFESWQSIAEPAQSAASAELQKLVEQGLSKNAADIVERARSGGA
ncbi:MAG: aminopeptidase N [Pseudomonadota bacterium]